jgi:hypothetical protein
VDVEKFGQDAVEVGASVEVDDEEEVAKVGEVRIGPEGLPGRPEELERGVSDSIGEVEKARVGLHGTWEDGGRRARVAKDEGGHEGELGSNQSSCKVRRAAHQDEGEDERHRLPWRRAGRALRTAVRLGRQQRRFVAWRVIVLVRRPIGGGGDLDIGRRDALVGLSPVNIAQIHAT